MPKALFLGLCLCLLIGGGLAVPAPVDPTAPTVGRVAAEPAGDPRLHPDRQQELLARRIGQMILIGFPGTAPDEPGPAAVAAMLGAGEIGGVVLFSDNVRSPAQLRRLTAALAGAAGSRTPFVAIDQEGGQIQRLTRRKGFVGLPSARAMAQKNLFAACDYYTRAATELAALGINTNFGPVVDLDVNPRSPAIGRKKRSYGNDPATVVAYAEAFIDAHARLGLLTAAKHFPGHGSAMGDSHTQLVDVTDTWRDAELAPYRRLIGEDAPAMIMVGHLIHPRFSDGDRPTSLSRRAITGALRTELGYDGLVVTDDLGMAAVARRFSLEDAAVMAVRAGADLLLATTHDGPDERAAARIAFAIAGAVASGRIPLATIERSFARIAAAKARIVAGRTVYGPPVCPQPPDTDSATGSVVPESHAESGAPPAAPSADGG